MERTDNDISMSSIELLTTLVKGIDAKIDKVSSKVEKLTEDNIVQKTDIERIKAEILLIKTRQSDLSNKIDEVEGAAIKEKAERWNMVVNNIIKAIVGLAFTAILAYIGIKVVK